MIETKWTLNVALVGSLFLASSGLLADRPGDSNMDGAVDISDPVGALSYLFLGATIPSRENANVNGDEILDISDPVYLLGFLFLGGPAPIASNRPPLAVLHVTKTATDRTVRCDSLGSEDSDGTIRSYEYDLGDGTVLHGPEVEHAYEEYGSYEIILTVTDDEGASATASSVVELVEPGPPEANPPTESAKIVVFVVNDIDLKSFVTDPDTPLEELTYEVTEEPEFGSYRIEDGILRLTPDPVWAPAEDMISFRASDELGSTVIMELTLESYLRLPHPTLSRRGLRYFAYPLDVVIPQTMYDEFGPGIEMAVQEWEDALCPVLGEECPSGKIFNIVIEDIPANFRDTDLFLENSAGCPSSWHPLERHLCNRKLNVFFVSPWSFSEGWLGLTDSATLVGTNLVFLSGIFMNNWNFAWTLDPEAIARNFTTTFMHELGHVLGLGHTVSNVDIMARAGDRNRDIVRLSANDRARIRAVYPEIVDPSLTLPVPRALRQDQQPAAPIGWDQAVLLPPVPSSIEGCFPSTRGCVEEPRDGERDPACGHVDTD